MLTHWSHHERLDSPRVSGVDRAGGHASQGDPKAPQVEKRGQAPQVKTEPTPVAPSEKLVLGFIGVGGQGSGLIDTFKQFPDVAIAAVCDVYEPHVRRAQSSSGGTPENYSDFRKVLDRKDIDAVVIATPDHWHGIATIMACQAGKDVYCEKPLGAPDRRRPSFMVRASEKYKRVTQMGNLIHSGENYHRVVEDRPVGRVGKDQ